MYFRKIDNLTRKTDARGVRTDYVYDALNRVTNRNYSTPGGAPPNYQATPNVSYFYDNLPNAKGKLIKVSSAPSTTEYTAFDILGRVTASRQTTEGGDPSGYTTGYVYNLSGALVEETYPSGRVVKNTLNADGELAQVESKKNPADFYRPYANSFVYTAAGAVSSLRLGNGKFENTVFNSRLQPVQIGLGSSATDTGLLKLNFDYGVADNNGNVKSQTITVPTVGQNAGFTAVQSYNYDALNRLKDATENVTPNGGSASQSWKQTFTFDRYGNRRFDAANTTTIPSGCAETVCNPQVDAATNKLIGYQFDASGNTKQDAESRKFTYDAENKQMKVETVDQSGNVTGTIGEYFYDGDGKRVKKIVPSTSETTVFVYDASNKLVAEYSTIVTPAQDAKVSYLTNDTLGSPRITTDQNGSVASRRDFMPYGEEIFSPQRTQALAYTADTIRQKFTGYINDDETGLDYAQARMFASVQGRFRSVDPYNIVFEKETGRDQSEREQILVSYISQPQVWNGYVYVSNNPLKYVDPEGEILELTGDERDRQQAFNRIKQLAGETAASKLRIAERDGRFFVEYNGSNNLMWAADPMAGIIADLIDSNVTNEYRVVYGNTVTDANGNSYSFSAQGGAVTVPVSSTRTQIFVSYNAENIANGIAFKDANGNRLKNTGTIVDAHEFGHAWGIQRDDVYNRIMGARSEWGEWASSIGSSRGTKEAVIAESNNRTAVMVENIVRDRVKLPRKIRHQP